MIANFNMASHSTCGHVSGALQHIQHILNVSLTQSVKRKFRRGKVGPVNVEHILCKIARKQTRKATQSTVWLRKSVDWNERGFKRKIASEDGSNKFVCKPKRGRLRV